MRPALEKAMNLPHCESGLSRSIVVVTDGYIRVEQETFDLIRNRLNEANLFTFGIGSSVNRHLLEHIVLETVETDNTTAQYQQAKQELQTYLDSLSLCQMPKSRSTLLTIKVDKTGRITTVDLSNDDAFSQCLKKALENNHLFSSFNLLSSTYKFELTLKTQD